MVFDIGSFGLGSLTTTAIIALVISIKRMR